MIKKDCYLLLETYLYKFTGGDSSVSKEQGQTLMDAILYSCSLYLRQYPMIKIITLLQTKRLLWIHKKVFYS